MPDKKPTRPDTITFVNDKITFEEVISTFQVYGNIQYINKHLNRYFIQFETADQAKKAQTQLGRIYRVTFAHAKGYLHPMRNFRVDGGVIKVFYPANSPMLRNRAEMGTPSGLAMIEEYVNNVGRRSTFIASTRNEVAGSNENPSERDRELGNQREIFKGSQNGREMAKGSENGRGMSKASENGRGMSKTSENGRGTSKTSEHGRGMSKTSENGRGMSKTPENGRGMSKTPENGRGMSKTSENGRGMSKTPENGRGMSKAPENRRETSKGSENRREKAKGSKKQSQRRAKQNHRGKPANPKPNSFQVRGPEQDDSDDSDDNIEERKAQKPKAQKRLGEAEEYEYAVEEEEENYDVENDEDLEAEPRTLGAATCRRGRIEELDAIMRELGSDTTYSVIMANIPGRYTLNEVYELVEEVRPIAFSEMSYSTKLRVKFCQIFVNDATDVNYLKRKLNDFVICGVQLTVMEPSEILDETRWNA